MENLRAFMLVTALKENGYTFTYSPQDIETDSGTSQSIINDGFFIGFSSKEEAEKAKAAEEAKKQQAASNSTGSDSSSSSSDSSTSASTTASDWGQSTWTLTGKNDNGEVCNAPVAMYKAKAQGKAGGWTADGEYCLWSAEGEDIGYRCDKNGNVIETF